MGVREPTPVPNRSSEMPSFSPVPSHPTPASCNCSHLWAAWHLLQNLYTCGPGSYLSPSRLRCPLRHGLSAPSEGLLVGARLSLAVRPGALCHLVPLDHQLGPSEESHFSKPSGPRSRMVGTGLNSWTLARPESPVPLEPCQDGSRTWRSPHPPPICSLGRWRAWGRATGSLSQGPSLQGLADPVLPLGRFR